MSSAPVVEVSLALRAADSVLFVCSGNMVRSAFAHVYAEHLGCPLRVRSAATTFRNERLFPETARALAARGVSAEAIERFRPTHAADLLPGLSGAPVAFGMTRAHLADLADLAKWDPARAYLLGALLGGEEEIADPVLEGADFGRTFSVVARCVEALVRELAGRT